jgi:hypothetical protein
VHNIHDAPPADTCVASTSYNIKEASLMRHIRTRASNSPQTKYLCGTSATFRANLTDHVAARHRRSCRKPRRTRLHGARGSFQYQHIRTFTNTSDPLKTSTAYPPRISLLCSPSLTQPWSQPVHALTQRRLTQHLPARPTFTASPGTPDCRQYIECCNWVLGGF